MNSKLFTGWVEHERFHPARHRLRYDLHVWALDLAELAELDRRLPLFGVNRPRPVAIFDRDYLDPQPGSIRRKLLRHVAVHRPPDTVARIVLVTSPRYFGHVFNPVSFYYCFGDTDNLVAAVAEVNNTFGEKHVYVLVPPGGGNGGFPARFEASKAFHVSPFNPMGGTYRFRFADIRRELDVRIDLHRGGEHILRARLVGHPRDLNTRTHMRQMLRHPLRPHLTMARIYREAFTLRFGRRLDFFPKPVPHSPLTVRRLPPTRFQTHCRRLILERLARASCGGLRLTLPDGTQREFGDPHDPAPVDMTVLGERFFSRVVTGGDIGLGEAFMFGEWDTDDIAGAVGFFIANRRAFDDGNFAHAAASRLIERVRYLARANTLPGSRRNIRQHYDLSNAFFQTFLDPSMAYSCALFGRPDEDLAAAQQNKYRAIIAKARLEAADHVLEIGCGWGGFALAAARQTGCRVTGITISKAQYDLTRERVRRAGLQDRITIRLCDYRRVPGRFDKIVSIEMLEAVGHAYFGTFFRRLDRLLAPQGIAVIQVITIPDQRYHRYRRSHDWIRKHIFPGGLLPSLTVLTEAMTRHSSLTVDHAENIGDHYALTLAHWHRRFIARRDDVARLGFDRTFRRKWAFYFGLCEAGFRARVLGDLQLVLAREGNTRLGRDGRAEERKTPRT